MQGCMAGVCVFINFTLLAFGIAMRSLHDCYGVVTYHSMLKLYCMHAGMHEPLQVKQTQLLFLKCACINGIWCPPVQHLSTCMLHAEYACTRYHDIQYMHGMV